MQLKLPLYSLCRIFPAQWDAEVHKHLMCEARLTLSDNEAEINNKWSAQLPISSASESHLH